MYNSKAAKPPATWAMIYGSRSSDGNLPAATIITETAGLKFPPENLPLALMRPLSGSGSLGLLTDLIEQYGPESLIAKIGATMFGSTETTFYVLAVYFGSVGIKKSRHALVAGLFADLVGIISAVFFCQLFFGNV